MHQHSSNSNCSMAAVSSPLLDTVTFDDVAVGVVAVSFVSAVVRFVVLDRCVDVDVVSGAVVVYDLLIFFNRPVLL